MIHYNYKTLVRGYKHYELSNHLGNVLVVISDKSITLCASSVVSGYETDVISASDYYPFGMLMSSRSYSSPAYRYGYQGSEKDNEISGGGNSYTTEYRELNSRLGGMWWSMDPEPKEWESPYVGFYSSPILFNDQDGADPTAENNQIKNLHRESSRKLIEPNVIKEMASQPPHKWRWWTRIFKHRFEKCFDHTASQRQKGAPKKFTLNMGFRYRNFVFWAIHINPGSGQVWSGYPGRHGTNNWKKNGTRRKITGFYRVKEGMPSYNWWLD